MESAEIRLRIVEALTRNDASHARNDTIRFTEAVAKIETYVVNGNSATEPVAAAKDEKPKPPRRAIAADKADPDFLE